MANIFDAAESGDVPRLKAILDAGGSVDEKDEFNGRTALHVAAGNGHVSAMALLLDRGADPSATTTLGRTTLHSATSGGDVTAMALLLDRGADVSATDNNGRTALHFAAWNGHVNAMALLLDCGADPTAADNYGNTALRDAAKNGHVTSMALLLDSGAILNDASHVGSTALHLVAREGHLTAMALLLDRGADVSATNKENETARDLAVRNNREAIVQEIDHFVRNMTDKWRPQRHTLYPLPFRAAVATVLALWGWNPTANAPWHPESPFPLLSLELLFEVFIWLGADIAERGYVVMVPVTPRDKRMKGKQSKTRGDVWCMIA